LSDLVLNQPIQDLEVNHTYYATLDEAIPRSVTSRNEIIEIFSVRLYLVRFHTCSVSAPSESKLWRMVRAKGA
jgi:hypothetical protein